MTNLGNLHPAQWQRQPDGSQVETYFRRVLNTNPGFGSALADVDYSCGCYRVR